jgi:hypothetical protein
MRVIFMVHGFCVGGLAGVGLGALAASGITRRVEVGIFHWNGLELLYPRLANVFDVVFEVVQCGLPEIVFGQTRLENSQFDVLLFEIFEDPMFDCLV